MKKMMFKILIWLYKRIDNNQKMELVAVVLNNINDGAKLAMADKLLGDVLKSKTFSIDDKMAERITLKIAKSTGNKICDFILKD